MDKLQKWICRTVGPSLAASLKPLAHCQNVASLSLFYRYYFGRCSSELAQLVPLPYFLRKYFLMLCLKQFMLVAVLRLLGSLFQVLGPIYDKLCIPNFDL